MFLPHHLISRSFVGGKLPMNGDSVTGVSYFFTRYLRTLTVLGSDIGNDVLDAELESLAGHSTQGVACSTPAAVPVDQNFLGARVISLLVQTTVQLLGLLNCVDLDVRLAAQLLVVVDDVLGVVAAAHPENTSLVEMRHPERVRLKDVLGLEGETAVEEIVVVSTNDLVPIPRSSYAVVSVIRVPVHDCD
ncbi:hypothetical protein HG531_001430 [Fusarium graminearum]|nr:hypothetical protein HG531_001430 [Fusarium graminearum]